MRTTKLRGFSSYNIFEDGRIYSEKSKKFMKQQTNSNGYKTLGLVDDLGVVRNMRVHRLVCLGFNDVPIDTELVVNHIDGNKVNNNLSNLELITVKENNWHAGRLGLTTKCTPVTIVKYPELFILSFNSINECAEFLGTTRDRVNYRVKSGKKRVFPDGFIYMESKDLESYLRDTTNFEPCELFGRKVRCLARELDTGNIIMFDKIEDMSKYYNTPVVTLYDRMVKNKQLLLRGEVMVKFDDGSPWRKFHSREIEELLVSPGRPLVYTDENGDETYFLTCKQAASHFGLKESTMNYRIKNNVMNIKYLDEVYGSA